jgi:LacI family transcriptional regulator, galactose operon repressor
VAHRVTLKDVAKYAGVSVTTVSNVVRDWPYISDEMRQKVQQAIEELGYSPHPIAQGLRTGQTQVIGFILPNLSDPHFGRMASVAEDVAREHGYDLLVLNSHENEARQNECIQRATSRWVDGLLIVTVVHPQETSPGVSKALSNVSVPIVAVDRLPEGYNGPSCLLDNFRAAQLAIEHLRGLGHERIAHLAGPRGAHPARERLNGYLQAAQGYGLAYQRVAFAESSWGCSDGYTAMGEVLRDDRRPTAVFASNDRMAIGASLAIHEQGLRIPEDISLVGMDDIEVSEYMNPTLTTVRQPLEAIARAGIDLLLDLICDETPDSVHVQLEPNLMVRRSTAPAGEHLT